MANRIEFLVALSCFAGLIKIAICTFLTHHICAINLLGTCDLMSVDIYA